MLTFMCYQPPCRIRFGDAAKCKCPGCQGGSRILCGWAILSWHRVRTSVYVMQCVLVCHSNGPKAIGSHQELA